MHVAFRWVHLNDNAHASSQRAEGRVGQRTGPVAEVCACPAGPKSRWFHPDGHGPVVQGRAGASCRKPRQTALSGLPRPGLLFEPVTACRMRTSSGEVRARARGCATQTTYFQRCSPRAALRTQISFKPRRLPARQRGRLPGGALPVFSLPFCAWQPPPPQNNALGSQVETAGQKKTSVMPRIWRPMKGMTPA